MTACICPENGRVADCPIAEHREQWERLGCASAFALTAGGSPDAPTDRAGDGHRTAAEDWASAYDAWNAEPREFPGHGRRLAFRAGWEAAAARTRAAIAAASEDCESAGWAEVQRLQGQLAAAEQRGRDETARRMEQVASELNRNGDDCHVGERKRIYHFAAKRIHAALADRSEATT